MPSSTHLTTLCFFITEKKAPKVIYPEPVSPVGGIKVQVYIVGMLI